MKRLAGLALSLTLTFGCSQKPASRAASGPATPSPSPSPVQALPATVPSPPADGTLVLTVGSDDGRPAIGLPVHITGPKNAALETRAGGKVTIKGPPGVYRAEVIAGCGERFLVNAGDWKTFQVRPAATTTGALAIDWLRRIGPGNGAYPSQVPDWITGSDVDLSFDVMDRCDRAKAPDVSLKGFGYRTGTNLLIVGTPLMRSDANALAHLVVRCDSPGPASVVLYDLDNPKDATDLVGMVFEYKVKCKEPSY